MTRENKYIIDIYFKKSNNNFIDYQLPSSYSGSRGFEDNIQIKPTHIKIIACRSKKINLDDVFYNHNNSMYIQIIKSIIFFYLNSKVYTTINKISIERFRKQKLLDSKEIKSKDLSQILSKNFIPLNTEFKFENLKKLFDDDEKGKAILIASSYIVKASATSDEAERFEHLWKALNKLYKFIGGNKNELNCQVTLRGFILNNSYEFPLSKKNVTRITEEQLYQKLRWRAFISNNFNTLKQTEAFSDFIKRYSDVRIMSVLKKTLDYKEEHLKNKNLYSSTLDYINSKIELNNNLDTEMIAILCIKYMYFVRNKLMHGENIDSTLRLLPNKELNELTWLNSILKALVIDLINCNDKY